jgi:predicted Zn-dependent protease
MSKTLHLIDALLARGRRLQQLGVTQEAFDLLHQLAQFRSLCGRTRREALHRLAVLYLKRGQRRAAHKLLTDLIGRHPNCAVYHYLLARACVGRSRAARRRVLEHCRRATLLDPKHAGRLATLGTLALKAGQKNEGMEALRRAARLAPDNPSVVRRLARGLCRMGRPEEARAVVLAARFRNASDQRFQSLWQDFQLGQLQRDQAEKTNTSSKSRRNAEPVFLPFGELTAVDTGDGEERLVRRDRASTLPAPYLPRPLRQRDERHAQ